MRAEITQLQQAKRLKAILIPLGVAGTSEQQMAKLFVVAVIQLGILHVPIGQT